MSWTEPEDLLLELQSEGQILDGRVVVYCRTDEGMRVALLQVVLLDGQIAEFQVEEQPCENRQAG